MHGTWLYMHAAAGIKITDTDPQQSTAAWLPGRAGSQQPHQERPGSQLQGRSSDRTQLIGLVPFPTLPHL